MGLVEREPLKPLLLQHGTKESTKGMARPPQKKKREKSPNEDVKISACEENWQKKELLI